jgi:hypothetical protein
VEEDGGEGGAKPSAAGGGEIKGVGGEEDGGEGGAKPSAADGGELGGASGAADGGELGGASGQASTGFGFGEFWFWVFGWRGVAGPTCRSR